MNDKQEKNRIKENKTYIKQELKSREKKRVFLLVVDVLRKNNGKMAFKDLFMAAGISDKTLTSVIEHNWHSMRREYKDGDVKDLVLVKLDPALLSKSNMPNMRGG